MLLETHREITGKVGGIYASWFENLCGLSYGPLNLPKKRTVMVLAALCTLWFPIHTLCVLSALIGPVRGFCAPLL